MLIFSHDFLHSEQRMMISNSISVMIFCTAEHPF